MLNHLTTTPNWLSAVHLPPSKSFISHASLSVLTPVCHFTSKEQKREVEKASFVVFPHSHLLSYSIVLYRTFRWFFSSGTCRWMELQHRHFWLCIHLDLLLLWLSESWEEFLEILLQWLLCAVWNNIKDTSFHPWVHCCSPSNYTSTPEAVILLFDLSFQF